VNSWLLHLAFDSPWEIFDADFGPKISNWPIIFAYFPATAGNHDLSAFVGFDSVPWRAIQLFMQKSVSAHEADASSRSEHEKWRASRALRTNVKCGCILGNWNERVPDLRFPRSAKHGSVYSGRHNKKGFPSGDWKPFLFSEISTSKHYQR
jgi:hypothetical protein